MIPRLIQVYATNGRAGQSDKLPFRSVFNVDNTYASKMARFSALVSLA